MAIAAIDENSRQILRLMMKKKVVSGIELLSVSQLDTQVLADALRALCAEGLIETNAMGFNKDTVAEAYFNLNFSSMNKARMLVGSMS